MDTEALIRELAQDVQPVSPNAVGKRVAAGLLAGAVATVALIGWWLGFRPDFDLAMRGYSFWIKWIYSGTLAACAVAATLVAIALALRIRVVPDGSGGRE